MILELSNFLRCDEDKCIIKLKEALQTKNQIDEYDRIYTNHLLTLDQTLEYDLNTLIPELSDKIKLLIFSIYFRPQLYPNKKFNNPNEQVIREVYEISNNNISILTFFVMISVLLNSLSNDSSFDDIYNDIYNSVYSRNNLFPEKRSCKRKIFFEYVIFGNQFAVYKPAELVDGFFTPNFGKFFITANIYDKQITPHGNIYKDPLSFLFHDMDHCGTSIRKINECEDIDLWNSEYQKVSKFNNSFQHRFFSVIVFYKFFEEILLFQDVDVNFSELEKYIRMETIYMNQTFFDLKWIINYIIEVRTFPNHLYVKIKEILSKYPEDYGTYLDPLLFDYENIEEIYENDFIKDVHQIYNILYDCYISLG